MKKLLLVLFTIATLSAYAQNKTANSLTYRSSAGLRIGAGGGLNLKTFISDKKAVEFIGFFNSEGTRIQGFYEFHGDLSTEGNLKWYIGPSLGVGFYSGVNSTSISIGGVIGLDYKFKELPLNIALDWSPNFVTNNIGFKGDWITLAVRYTF